MKNFAIFTIGAVGYGILEIIWRGYTHISMLLAGGICLLGIKFIYDFFGNHTLFAKALLASAFISAVEAIIGFIVNIKLSLNVWSYSSLPFNIGGQVCLLFSFFWFLLSLVIMIFFRLQKKLSVSSN